MENGVLFRIAIWAYICLVIIILWKTPTKKQHLDQEGKTRKILNNTIIPIAQREMARKLNSSLPRYFGPGADNKMVVVPSDEHYAYLRNKFFKVEVNNYMSDVIGYKRIQSDHRPIECQTIQYPRNLPQISIVVIFRDEPIPTLLRTVYNILETSPSQLVKELVLVDDGSENDELKITVDIHVQNVDKLILVRNDKPLGLMLARQKGIETTRSDYFIVLDGHVEVSPGWLEPIIHRLVQEPNALLTSHIGVINAENFIFSIGRHDTVFMFFDQITTAELWIRYSDEFLAIRNGSVEPIEFGIVPGMMMAMRKAFFLQLGGFDPGMEIWGMEHVEMSVKVWLCGGRVEMVPCSKLGHVYRPAPWQMIHKDKQYISKNILRFILVWMDGDLQRLALEVQSRGNMSKPADPGNIDDRIKIKLENKCKPYQYYIDVVRKLTNTYIPEPRKLRAKGVVVNRATKSCLDMASLDRSLKLITYSCTGYNNQYFVYTEDFNIRVDRAWLKVNPDTKAIEPVRDIEDWSKPEFKWTFDGHGTIKHNLTGLCITAGENGKISLEMCTGFLQQLWDWPLH